MKFTLLPHSITRYTLPLFLFGFSLQAATHYYNDFLTSPYGAATDSWVNYRDTGTEVLSPGPFSVPHFANWLQSGPAFSDGYIFVQHQAGAQASDYLLHTNSSTSLGINPSTLGFQSVYAKWQESSDLVTRHLAMQVDGQWYINQKTDPLSSGTNRSLDLLSAAWYRLNVTLGTGGSISFDTSSTYHFKNIFTSASSTINSFGFYVDMPAVSAAPNITARFDKITLTSGIHWGGTSGTGGAGTWNTSNTNLTWKQGAAGSMTSSAWSNNETAIFGHTEATGAPGIITVTSNITARTLEFYQNANGYILQGDIAPGSDLVPLRTIQLNNETNFRNLYVAPDVNVTVGGNAATGLRIHKTGSPLHIYGGGVLTIAQNGMVRTESGGDLILNDGTTVEVTAGGQFNASRNLYIGNDLDTLDDSTGNAHLILNGGSTITRTGSVGGDLILGGASGTANLTLKNGGTFTTHVASPTGVIYAGDGNIQLETGGTLSTRRISKKTGATGNASIHFDGGTLAVNALAGGTNSFIGTDINSLIVSNGGAIIHTHSFDATIQIALTHDSAGAAKDGGLTKLGNGTLTMDVANTHTGATIIRGGTLKSNTLAVLGISTDDASNLILDGGTLWITGNGLSNNRGFTVGQNGGTLKASLTYRFNGQVHGAAGTTLNIDGSAWLSGNSKTTFHGDINVIAGEFLVRRAASLGSITGNITVRSGATFNTDHNGTGGGGNSPSDNNYADAMILEQNATFGSRGRNGASGAGSDAGTIYSGSITLNGPGASTIRVANWNGETTNIPDMTVTGQIQGLGALQKTGAGKLILTHQNTYSGKTQIAAGTLALSATGSVQSPWIDIQASAFFDVSATTQPHALSNQTLSGTGSIQGSLSFGAGTYLKPGNSSDSTLLASAGDAIGSLSFANGLSLDSQSTAILQIGGTALNDKLIVQGAFNALNNSSIEVQWNNYQASLGESFDLLDFSSSTWGTDYQTQLLSRLILPTFSDSGLAWDTSDFMSQGILRVAAIPEPSRTLLCGLSLALYLLRRKRM